MDRSSDAILVRTQRRDASKLHLSLVGAVGSDGELSLAFILNFRFSRGHGFGL